MKPTLVSEKLGCLQWQHSLAWLEVCKLSKRWHFANTKVRKDVMPFIYTYIYVALGTVSCSTHWRATLSISTRITGAPVSHIHPTQQHCKRANVLDTCTRNRVVTEFLSNESSRLIEIDNIWQACTVRMLQFRAGHLHHTEGPHKL
jgi:hypothetical protein